MIHVKTFSDQRLDGICCYCGKLADTRVEQWRTYLKEFKGDLFMCGDPIVRNELLMWYEPRKCFVTYYAP